MGQTTSRKREQGRSQMTYRSPGSQTPYYPGSSYQQPYGGYQQQPSFSTAAPATTTQYISQPQPQQIYTPQRPSGSYRYSYAQEPRTVYEEQQFQPHAQVYGAAGPSSQGYVLEETMQTPSTWRGGWNRLSGTVQSGVGRTFKSAPLVERGVQRQVMGKAEQYAAKTPGRATAVEVPTGMMSGGVPVVQQRVYIAEPPIMGPTSAYSAETTSTQLPPPTPRLSARELVQEQPTGVRYEMTRSVASDIEPSFVQQGQQPLQQQPQFQSQQPAGRTVSEAPLQQTVYTSAPVSTAGVQQQQQQQPQQPQQHQPVSPTSGRVVPESAQPLGQQTVTESAAPVTSSTVSSSAQPVQAAQQQQSPVEHQTITEIRQVQEPYGEQPVQQPSVLLGDVTEITGFAISSRSSFAEE